MTPTKSDYSLLIFFQVLMAIGVRSIQTRLSTIFNLIGCLATCYLLVTAIDYVWTNSRNDVWTNSQKDVVETNEILRQEQVGKPTSSRTTASKLSPKMILFWTPYYNRTDFGVGLGDDVFVKFGCQETNCVTTSDRQLLDESDAVLFHALQVSSRDLPARRRAEQRFIFFLYETIPNTSIPCVGKCLPSSQYQAHYFNWTMTHRRDSDVYVAEQYGAVAPNDRTLAAPQLPDALPADTLPADPAVLLNGKYPHLANKTNMVAWFASHCPTHSRREDYVKELATFIQVDVYGKCGTMECLPRNSHRCERLLDTYKFYLAAENSLCPDYVSEKFYRALTNDIVPIVYGGADYTQYAPPHSFINLADFQSAKHLADYLTLLAQNDALYMQYFQWKKHYTVVRSPKKGWCDLCAKLNDVSQPIQTKTYPDVADWWVRKVPCYPGSAFLMNHT